MKYNLFILLYLSFLFASCNKPLAKENKPQQDPIDTILVVPTNQIEKSELSYNRYKSLWTKNEKLFSGYAVSYYSNGNLKEKFGILNGRKQNEEIQWFLNGTICSMANYYKGKLHGEKKSWTSDSSYVLISHLNYYLGKAHGQQKKWYPTGELFKVLNLNMGKEEGIQQAFRKNGDLYANYEAKEGRIFGLKKAKLCYSLEEENME